MKTLVIIPARAGSKGIPQKNIRYLNGRPLIHYAIRNALSLEDADVFVSTDSPAIGHVAGVLGAGVLLRDRYCGDGDTLDDVVRYELDRIEAEGARYDTVITMLPTSPLLKPRTLREALAHFRQAGPDSLISCRRTARLSWTRGEQGFVPLYKARVIRQELDPLFEENGAFLICGAEQIRRNGSRIGERVELYPVAEDESVDIDSRNDWILAENILRRRNIAIVTNGSVEMGMGHIYRSLTLSMKLSNDRVHFFSQRDNRLGIDKLRSLHYPVNEYRDWEHLLDMLRERDIQLVINDTLDTEEDYMRRLKAAGYFVVNFEDTGLGANHADLVFNALYEWSNSVSDNYYGYQYEVLREDIYLYPVKAEASPDLQRILIGFGGTDPNNATLRVLRALQGFELNGVTITVVLGVGYRYEAELGDYLQGIDTRHVRIVKDVATIADYLYHSDLVISGNGRMVYETVALGVPLIVISQNEREMAHIFPKVCKGIAYLGYIETLDTTQLKTELLMYEQRHAHPGLRADLQAKAQEIRRGANRVINIINQKYDDAAR